MTSAHDQLRSLPPGPLGAHLAVASRAEPLAPASETPLGALECDLVGRRFLAEYAGSFDAKDDGRLLELYAEDCVLVNTNATFVGIDAIRTAQVDDMPKTEMSFHHFSNVVTGMGDDRLLWVSAYMYNLAVREDQHYGTVGTFIASLRAEGDRWLASAIRIDIDSRHLLNPILMRPAPTPGHASGPETSFDLVGRRPRFPSVQSS